MAYHVAKGNNDYDPQNKGLLLTILINEAVKSSMKSKLSTAFLSIYVIYCLN